MKFKSIIIVETTSSNFNAMVSDLLAQNGGEPSDSRNHNGLPVKGWTVPHILDLARIVELALRSKELIRVYHTDDRSPTASLFEVSWKKIVDWHRGMSSGGKEQSPCKSSEVKKAKSFVQKVKSAKKIRAKKKLRGK